jgi:hypothetical protein
MERGSLIGAIKSCNQCALQMQNVKEAIKRVFVFPFLVALLIAGLAYFVKAVRIVLRVPANSSAASAQLDIMVTALLSAFLILVRNSALQEHFAQ